jgi:nucleotide-binding universal stress UspA family protein
VDAPPDIDSDRLPSNLAAVLDRSPADVGIVVGVGVDTEQGAGVFVPFGGGDHDWAALELGAQLAAALSSRLTLIGSAASPGENKRDASRLLADASLAVQRVVGVETSPFLVAPTGSALIAASREATVIVTGISARWRRDGIGSARRALVRDARPPVLIVHRGPRPGSLAPVESRTSFSWSIEVS